MSPRIEPLEARIAPASLIDPRTVTFTDADGDDVKIVFSRNVFLGTDTAMLAKANEVFKFSAGDVAHDTTTHQQLQLIDLTRLSPLVRAGVGMTITATAKDGGNGFADIGAIKAAGVSLSTIAIDGDVGQIDAGGSGLKFGIKSLVVNSLGVRGIATQIPVPVPTAENPAPDLVSTITGELTSLKVLGDIKDARLRVVDGRDTGGNITTAAKLGIVTIGGSLIGGIAAEVASDDTGVIECDRGIGAIKIGSLPTDGIVGGGGSNSGRITSGGAIASLTITGSIAGGAGASSGFVSSFGNLGAVNIGNDLAGGAGEDSGFLRGFGAISSLTIGDDILAGTGAGSGSVRTLGAITKLLVKGDIDARIANAGPDSASLFSNGLPLATVNGSIFGGAGAGSGVIASGRDVGAVTLATLTTPTFITGITLLGSVNGGAGDGSGAILADGSVKLAKIKGSLIGDQGRESGVLRLAG
ncbi:MAG: hypothetical protein ABMA13_16965, partial [Chthoniobacteraceae bacterium]